MKATVVSLQSSGGGGGPEPASLDVLCRALAALNLLAAREAMAVAGAEGLDRRRVLDIVNASTGRSEATRGGATGRPDAEALRAAARLAAGAGTWAPLTALAAAIVG